MKAKDIMTTHLVVISPDLEIRAAANTMVRNNISALPVIDYQGNLVGIVSEGDLLRRNEIKTERHRSWWLEIFTSSQTIASEYIKSHARKVRDVMTTEVVTVTPDTTLSEIASLFERRHIKRVPIVESGKVVGIVSRANLVQALANTPNLASSDEKDATLRREIIHRLDEQPWAHRPFSVHVRNGNVDLSGFVYTQEERDAIRVATEVTPGVESVTNHLRITTAPLSY